MKTYKDKRQKIPLYLKITMANGFKYLLKKYQDKKDAYYSDQWAVYLTSKYWYIANGRFPKTPDDIIRYGGPDPDNFYILEKEEIYEKVNWDV